MATAWSTAAADAGVVADVEAHERRRPAAGLDRVDGLGAVVDVGHDHLGALAGEQLGGDATRARWPRP